MNKSIKDQLKGTSKEVMQLIDRAIELALVEDLGAQMSDLTTDSIVPANATAKGEIVCKEAGIIVGLDVAALILSRFDERIQLTPLIESGTYIKDTPSDIAKLTGPAAPILKGERLALNLLQRMSGIATVTAKFVEKAKGTGIEILDTRKTMPCIRAFDRIAVAAAGGTNHRFGLFDAVLIKDNHLRLAGSITNAINLARKANPGVSIEVETTDLAEVQEAVDAKAERILLDNMSPEMIRQAIKLISGRAYIEVSGGVKLSNVDGYLIEGVNGISIGALTHSAPGLDISLEVETFV
jgi:nicotinate-nucleotide pyrophosphorylase (carboxylating)